MTSLALANAIYPPAFAYVHPWADVGSGNNVVAVDFKRKQRAVPAQEAANVSAAAKEWRQVATSRLADLCRLAEGWDGVGSIGIPGGVLAKANRVLDLAFSGGTHPAPPTAVPCGDGSIQLEWWLLDTRFEFTIETNGEMEAWALDRDNGHEFSAEGSDAIELLSKWSGRLTADKLVRP